VEISRISSICGPLLSLKIEKMTHLKLFLTIFLLFSLAELSAQVTWTPIQDAEKQASATGKKIMVKVYANWCGWCKEMDKATFPNKNVAKILTESYVSVQFNAEQKAAVTWGGVPYKLIKTKSDGHYHELAARWLNGNLTYPTIVFLDENGKVIQAISGYRRAAEFEKMAAYFAKDAYKTTSWDAFSSTYKRE
jgi:thioredoxin-related protein